MAKSLKVRDERGKEYVLEFTRKSVERIERQGFKISEIAEFPATNIPMLFHAAFNANYSYVRREEADKIYAYQKNKQGLTNYLTEMYAETLNTIIGDEDAYDSENPTWEAN